MISEAVELTKRLVQIDSTNPGKEEKEIADAITRYLQKEGIPVICEETAEGRPNLVAQIRGETEEPSLVFVCHMDTVVVGSGWTKDPFEARLEDGKIYGRGACDMKAGLACALAVFVKLHRSVEDGEVSLNRTVKLICTADEEGSMTGVEAVIAAGHVKKQDWVLDLEPTDGQIQMAHKGRLWIHLTVKGVTAHASRPELGADAIAAAGEVICRLRKRFVCAPEHKVLGRSTVTFGQIRGGYQPYVVPDLAEMWIDMRLAPPFTSELVLDMLEQIFDEVREEIPGIGFSCEITGNRPYIEENETSELKRKLREICREVTGQSPCVKPFPGYTDTAVIAGLLDNHECLSYGPGSLSLAHKPDEYVPVEDILRCEAIYLELVKRICC